MKNVCLLAFILFFFSCEKAERKYNLTCQFSRISSNPCAWKRVGVIGDEIYFDRNGKFIGESSALWGYNGKWEFANNHTCIKINANNRIEEYLISVDDHTLTLITDTSIIKFKRDI